MYKTHTYDKSFAMWAHGSICHPEKLGMIKRRREEEAAESEKEIERESERLCLVRHTFAVL